MAYNREIDADLPPLSEEDIVGLAREARNTGETNSQQAQRILEQHLVPAAKTICNLALYSNDASLRFRAAKYVVDKNLGEFSGSENGIDRFDGFLADIVREESDAEN